MRRCREIAKDVETLQCFVYALSTQRSIACAHLSLPASLSYLCLFLPLTNNALRCGALVMSLACAPIKAEIDSHLYSFDHVEHIVHDGLILEGM